MNTPVEWDKDGLFNTPDRSELFQYRKSNVILFQTIPLPIALPISIPVTLSPSAGEIAGPGEVIVNIDVLGKTMSDEFAHKKKKQSTGKSGGDKHAKQYTHGGKNKPSNPNQRRGAEKRRNVGKEEN